ncbi:MAG: hypothetical protein IJ370_06900 [Oscillospiraceae bacterium]|nr:hypothetical protein [Oscillospiraceae bacterium]
MLYSAIAAAVLIAVVMVSLYPRKKAPSGVSSLNTSLEFTPQDSDRFTLLCTLSQNGSSSPYAYFLLGFNGPLGQISVTRLFSETVLTEDGAGNKVILGESFDKNGAKGAAGELNRCLGLEVSRYISFTNSSLIEFAELFDPVTLNVPQDLSQVDRKKDIFIKIDKGRQQFGGALFADYIACTAWKFGASQTLKESAEAVTAFLRQNHEALSLALDERAEEFILSKTKTNISVTDVERRRELVKFLLFESGDGVITLAVDGEYKNANTEFHLSEQSRKSLRSRYGSI